MPHPAALNNIIFPSWPSLSLFTIPNDKLFLAFCLISRLRELLINGTVCYFSACFLTNWCIRYEQSGIKPTSSSKYGLASNGRMIFLKLISFNHLLPAEAKLVGPILPEKESCRLDKWGNANADNDNHHIIINVATIIKMSHSKAIT